MKRDTVIHFLVTFAVGFLALMLLGFLDALWLRTLLAVVAGMVGAVVTQAVLRRGPRDPSDVRGSDGSHP